MVTPVSSLDGLKVPNIDQYRAKCISKLGSKLSQVAYPLIGYSPLTHQPFTDYNQRERGLEEAGKALDAFSARDRIRIFDSLFFGHGKYVEAGWQLKKKLPYQRGYLRKSFRVPDNPEESLESRQRWLNQLLHNMQYEHDLLWYAKHSGFIPNSDPLGYLFAGAIETQDSVGQQLLQLLIDRIYGNDETSPIGRYAVRALLICSHLAAWQAIESLLLAAQRQEGLRQVILETIDEGHPEAFKRMVKLILDHDLTRFSATVRAVDVWFDLGWQAEKSPVVKEVLEMFYEFLSHPTQREKALLDKNNQRAYIALWSIGFENVSVGIAQAVKLLEHKQPEKRFIAVHFLSQVRTLSALNPLMKALEDDDLRVVVKALHGINTSLWMKKNRFDYLEKVVTAFPEKKTTLPSIVWSWMKPIADKQDVFRLMNTSLQHTNPERLIPYLSQMNANNRFMAVLKLREIKDNPRIHHVLLELLLDRSSTVRTYALQGLQDVILPSSEVTYVEGLLTQTKVEVRRAALTLLLNLSDREANKSAERLLASSDPQQQKAGQELLAELSKKHRTTKTTIFAQKTSKSEVSLDNCLGLIDPHHRTQPEPPRKKYVSFLFHKNFQFTSDSTRPILRSISNLIDQHKDMEVTFTTYNGENRELLGNLKWGVPEWNFFTQKNTLNEETTLEFPLKEIAEQWFQQRPDQLRDVDGMELWRAYAALAASAHRTSWNQVRVGWLREVLQTLYSNLKKDEIAYDNLVLNVLGWLIKQHPAPQENEFLLDATEMSFNLIPRSQIDKALYVTEYYTSTWRSDPIFSLWHRMLRQKFWYDYQNWNDTHIERFWNLLRWFDQPKPHMYRSRPTLEEVMRCYEKKIARVEDIYDQLIGPRGEKFLTTAIYTTHGNWYDLQEVTKKKKAVLVQKYPFLEEIVENCREKIISLELHRGDLPTEVSTAALNIKYVEGMKYLFEFLKAIGDQPFTRRWKWTANQPDVLSHFAQVTFPKATETAADFNKYAKESGLNKEKLIELAIFAPQWAVFVEKFLAKEGFSEAIWWLHAHTKDQHWVVDKDIRDQWMAEVQQRTSLLPQDLLEGAVDVEWFHSFYTKIGKKYWEEITEYAKFASGGNGHRRACTFASAMLGELDLEETIEKVTVKRNQDMVRALGLIPLKTGKKREQDLIRRYNLIQQFQKESKQFGSQRQNSEKLAARIALINLARNAGYIDPLRLTWALETSQLQDFQSGFIQTKKDGYTITLQLTDTNDVELHLEKSGKSFQSIPKQLKGSKEIKELEQRKKELKNQIARIKPSLENAMCNGDLFTYEEIVEMHKHPLLAPILKTLVFVQGGSRAIPIVGILDNKGKNLQSVSGKSISLKPNDQLRIAHPYDLFQAKEWEKWQKYCFDHQLVQPFKQIFRELYVLTSDEKKEKVISRRYAGHQLQTRKALALLRSRGWLIHPEEGIQKIIYHQRISCELQFQGDIFTPGDIEGLTLEGVHFTPRNEFTPIPLEKVAPETFSEVMRDLDLVVSVAHAGGVDPESTSSTIEMRAKLVTETARLLKLTNVQVKENHVIIDGKLGNYSVHLGSGVVHKRPGGMLLILPVHGQHKGRIFLPFADNDPKSAEIVSKVLLLAEDQKLQDPTILEQIVQ